MTLEMQQALEREMDDAVKIADPDRRHDAVLTVLGHQLRALVDCQRKTADRVKEICADRERMNWVKRGVSGFLAAGGFTVLVKLLKMAGYL